MASRRSNINGILRDRKTTNIKTTDSPQMTPKKRPSKVECNSPDRKTTNSNTAGHNSPQKTPKKRPSKMEYDSPDSTPKKKPSKIEYDSPDSTPKKRITATEHNSTYNTPKRKLRSDGGARRSTLNFSDESATEETENKEEIDEVLVICRNTRKMSITIKKRSRNAKNLAESIVQNNPGTPRSRTSLKLGSCTPSAKQRIGVLAKPATPLQKARLKLHISAVPKSLPCREEEFNNIYMFLESKLMDNRGGCIYVSGVPGTGKTATVNEVVKCLKRSMEKHKLDPFNFVEINGMKLSEPRQAYVQILKQLSGKALTWEQAYNALEKRFKSSIKRPMTLLLVDELDLLCTKRQDVIYNLLDWPTKASAQLVVITIANTMDLPERVLMGRVTSRLGLTRVSFQPYNHEQLQEIIITRLKDTDIFKNEAIQLIARKVSAVSGDARRALDICRRAAEITEASNGTTVSMKDVNQALSEMMASPKIRVIQHCSKMEQIFLQAVCAEVTRTGVEEVCFKNVYKQFESLCCFDGFSTPNVTEAFGICERLGSSKLLICEDSLSDIYQKMILNVSKDDTYYALK